MIVGGEEGPGAERRGVVDVFRRRPGDAEAVEGARSPPDLIQDDQTPFCGMAEDVRHLVHLHHEGALPPRQAVRRADAGKDPVDHPDPRPGRGDETPHLGHENDQGHLPDAGRFPGHVGPGNNQKAVFLQIEKNVIGDETGPAGESLDNRMPAVRDLDDILAVDHGATVVVTLGHLGERRDCIQIGYSGRRPLDPADLTPNPAPDFDEEIVLPRLTPLLCMKDGLLVPLQLLVDVPLRVDQGLLPDIVRGNQMGVRLRDLDVIPEDVVETYLEGVDTCPLPFFLLQGGNPLPAVPHDRDQVIQLRIIPLPDDPPLADRERRIIHDRAFDQPPEVRHLVDSVTDRPQERGFAPGDGVAEPRQGLNRRPERGEIPAVGEPHGDPASETLQIVNGFKNPPERLPEEVTLPDLGNGGQPLPDPERIAKGVVQPPAESPPPERGHRLVEDVKERPSLLPLGDRGKEFEVPFGDLVQDQMGAAFIPGKLVDVVKTVLLRFRHVGKNGAGRSRRRRMGFKGHSRQLFLREMVAQEGFSRRRVEAVRRQAVDPTALPLPGKGPDQVAVAKVLRNEKFADRKSGRLYKEKFAVARLGDTEFPRGNVDKSQGEAALPDDQGCKKVILLGIEVLCVEDEAGGDHADHLALHHPLGEFRILHLLADGHLEPFFDQLRDVPGCGMVRKTAKGDGVFFVLVSRRQRDLEDPGGRHGILEEHLIEVAHPEEDDAVGVALLHIHVLAHGRAQVFHSHRPRLCFRSM